jgi:hypothetical protein
MRLYAARLGTDHEKTNIAAGALAALDEPVVATVAHAQAPASVAVTPSRTPVRSSDTRVAGAAAAPRTSPVRPSFDCSKARSRSERLICADPQLAQLDRELGRLHAQAKAAAPDAKDFKRRSDAEWKRREQGCRDRACLLAWYAQRRTQLLDEIDAQHARRTATATRR